MEHIVRLDVGSGEQFGRGDAGEDDGCRHAGLLAHLHVGLQPIADDDTLSRRKSQPVEDGTGGDGRGLADDDLDRPAGAALDRADDRRRVGEAAGGRGAVPIGVGGDEARPGAHRVERDLEFAVVEGAVERGDDELDLMRPLAQAEACRAQFGQQRGLPLGRRASPLAPLAPASGSTPRRS